MPKIKNFAIISFLLSFFLLKISADLLKILTPGDKYFEPKRMSPKFLTFSIPYKF